VTPNVLLAENNIILKNTSKYLFFIIVVLKYLIRLAHLFDEKSALYLETHFYFFQK